VHSESPPKLNDQKFEVGEVRSVMSDRETEPATAIPQALKQHKSLIDHKTSSMLNTETKTRHESQESVFSPNFGLSTEPQTARIEHPNA